MSLEKRSFWLGAGPLRAFIEATLLACLLFLLFSRINHTPFSNYANQVIVLVACCLAFYLALRMRLPTGSWKEQVAVEALWAALTGLLLSGFLLVFIYTFLADAYAVSTNTLGVTGSYLILGLSGPLYLALRVGVRLWLYWGGLRRRRMLWSLTHAQLILILPMAFLALTIFTALALQSSVLRGGTPEVENVPAFVALRFLFTVFPVIGVVAFLTVFAILALLPFSALFSYLFARKTTHRLEELSHTAEAFRNGDYTSRVAVAGEDEVAQLQGSFNAMANDLETTLRELQIERDKVAALLKSRQELVASVSHELRTPIATVRAYLDSAQSNWEQELPRGLEHDLNVIGAEVDRLQNLIDDLFTLSRAEVGNLSMDCKPTDIGAAARRIVDTMAPIAWRSDRVEIVAQTGADLPLALVDEARFSQILINLLRNAVHHTSPGGIVAVTLEKDGEYALLQVHDTGEGIPPEALPHIWERFYRAGDSQNRGQSDSAGLGLALVKELAEAMGGSVAVSSQLGEGSVFSIRLPLA